MTSAATAGKYLARAIQLGLVFVAGILLIGALQMPVYAFAVVGVFALVLFAGVGVVELLAVRPLERRA